MLDAIAHRGGAGRDVFQTGGVTMGAVWPSGQTDSLSVAEAMVQDRAGSGRLARAVGRHDRLTLERDGAGVAPLYYGRTSEGVLCFASEVKALLSLTRQVMALPPGGRYDGIAPPGSERPSPGPELDAPPELLAAELRGRLESAVVRSLSDTQAGVWLSGGLDSSAIATLARRYTATLHTFAVGLPGAPDLAAARRAAEYLGTRHHELAASLDEVVRELPAVIFHLESFDALLVRSSVLNFLAGKAASSYVAAVLSGEGGDELFAGYEYLRWLPAERLGAELLDITSRLHNTALQRVDRCSQAHGVLACVPFLDPQVVEYALRIPTRWKLHEGTEKWILRQAVRDDLPEPLRNRRKAKFWEGAGIGDLLAQRAEEGISDAQFQRERVLSNGWRLQSKEEVMYYRIFRDHFGDLPTLDWMGRTRRVPGSPGGAS